MAILDELTPAYYKVLRLGMQRQDGEVAAIYDIAIRNVLGQHKHVTGEIGFGLLGAGVNRIDLDAGAITLHILGGNVAA